MVIIDKQHIPCPHRHDDTCAIAAEILGHICSVTDNACHACDASSKPQAVNEVTVSLAVSAARKYVPDRVTALLEQYTSLLQASPPSLAARAVSLARATTKWLVAGRPLRDGVEVARLYDHVCGPCPQREASPEADISWCRQCGCRLARTDRVFHKLMLATEHCPLGKW